MDASEMYLDPHDAGQETTPKEKTMAGETTDSKNTKSLIEEHPVAVIGGTAVAAGAVATGATYLVMKDSAKEGLNAVSGALSDACIDTGKKGLIGSIGAAINLLAG